MTQQKSISRLNSLYLPGEDTSFIKIILRDKVVRENSANSFTRNIQIKHRRWREKEKTLGGLFVFCRRDRTTVDVRAGEGPRGRRQHQRPPLVFLCLNKASQVGWLCRVHPPARRSQENPAGQQCLESEQHTACWTATEIQLEN